MMFSKLGDASGSGQNEGMSAWDSLQPVWIHSSQNMEAIAQARKESLHASRVDHQFHYASPRQTELWLAVHRAHSPAVTNTDVKTMYERYFAQTAPTFARKKIHVVGLGCGGGQKDLALLEALETVQATGRFTPVDVSPSLALLSADRTREFCDEPIRPIVADLLHFPDLPAVLDEIDGHVPRVFTFFGMIPNFEPESILPLLRSWLRPVDTLLLSANLVPALDESTEAYRGAMEIVRPQYDNPETREWLSRILIDWGMEGLAPSYTLRVEEENGLLRFVAQVERLRLFFSYRYTPERLRRTLAAHGLALGGGAIAPSHEEGVWTVTSLPTANA